MSVPSLQYEPDTAARPVVVEHDGGVTRIIVPMQVPYVPIPSWISHLDLLAVVVAPVWWVATLLIRVCLRLPKPPRAVFEVDGERFKMTLRDPASGETSNSDWARAAVVEARANRYDAGLWMSVTGHVKDTYLSDLPRETIQRLEAALSAALAGGGASPAAAVGHAH
jgi:hypothetical protein